MSRFALSVLEDSWLRPKEADTPSLTAEILGKIATCALLLHARRDHHLFKSVDVESLFLRSLDTAPECVRKLLHLEYKVSEVALQEGTEMTLGVQRAGIAGRLNPGNERLQVKWSQPEAYTLLKRYEYEFPDVVSWIQHEACRQAEG